MTLSLRDEILAYMREKKQNARGEFCTWWFKFHVDCDTKTIRRELESMERAGLVTSDHGQRNNTKWRLVDQELALEARRVAWNRAQQLEGREQVAAPLTADLAKSIETSGGVA